MPFVTREPLDLARISREVESPAHGAVCTFAGVVRDHDSGQPVVALEYECYPEMAEREMGRVRDDVLARWPGCRIALVHRVGRLLVGEVSVAIAVGSPHRAEAFEACRHAIDTLKATVPIWKKEIHPDGAAWKGNRPA
ncbi:molybdenum cofactor biosynthesis protein MoaE [Myxococcota bacterium]|nr:molybdenum cofactor biosynthesis protein MoaE [Myxococcota bacterium]